MKIVLFALAILGLVPPAHAADVVDSIVVRFRDSAVAPDAMSLPASFEQSLRAQLRIPFTIARHTRDGAWVLKLAASTDLTAVRAALNTLRLDSAIAYANVDNGPPRPAAGGLPTDRIIVKFRDAAQVVLARADVPLDAPRIDRLAARAGHAIAWRRGTHDGANVLQLFERLPVQEVESIAASIEQDAEIDYAVPDYIRTANLVPSDPCYASPSTVSCNSGYQWDLFDPVGGINMPAAWNITTGSPSIRVAILDTGALLNHPDLAGRFVGGYDMVADCAVANDNQPVNCTWTNQSPATTSRDSNAADPGDWITAAESNPLTRSQRNNPPYFWFQGCSVDASSWHGTHVAGTIGAIPNNGIGIAGINWVSPLVPVRVLGKCGGYDSDINDAMVWASGGSVPGVPANNTPARVISLSLGGSGSCDAASQAAVSAAVNNGAVVVVAAGNDNSNAASYSPASCNGVVTVGATTKEGLRARYSNWGPTVEIAAPGGNAVQGELDILSTLNSGAQGANAAGYNYVQYAGTSMATPHVSGVVSLMLSANPSLTPAQVLSKLQTSARAFPTPGPACSSPPQASKCNCTQGLCGAGILDAGAAVAAAGSGGGGATATTTTVGSNLNPSTSGQTVTFTATVTGNNPGGGVDFKDAGNAIVACSAIALTGVGNTRTAQCATASLSVATHSITAVYLGDAANLISTSSALSQVVNGSVAATTTALASVPNPSTVGQNVAFTATINGGSSPTGTVDFKDGLASIVGCGVVTVIVGGTRTATCNTTALTQGLHSVTAVYSGDASNASSTSSAITQTVNAGGAVATTTALGSAPNPSSVGQNVAFTVAVAGGSPPTGTINFTDGASSIGGCAAVALIVGASQSTATCNTTSLAAGGHTITATYSGDVGHTGSSSAPLTQTVNGGGGGGAATTTTLAISPNPSTVGQKVSLFAGVSGSSLTGTVNFKDGGASIPGCSAVALSGFTATRTATCSTTALALGAHSISAIYSGDPINATSTSAPLTQTVN